MRSGERWLDTREFATWWAFTVTLRASNGRVFWCNWTQHKLRAFFTSKEPRASHKQRPLLNVLGSTDQTHFCAQHVTWPNHYYYYFCTDCFLVILHELQLCFPVWIWCVVTAFEKQTPSHCAFIAQLLVLYNLLKGDSTLTSHHILQFSAITSTIVHEDILFTNLLERTSNFSPLLFLPFTVRVHENVR